jgi:hypothetical protein
MKQQGDSKEGEEVDRPRVGLAAAAGVRLPATPLSGAAIGRRCRRGGDSKLLSSICRPLEVGYRGGCPPIAAKWFRAFRLAREHF